MLLTASGPIPLPVFIVIDHRLDLARTELEVPSACPAPYTLAPAADPRLGLDLAAPDSSWESREAATELLLSAQNSLQSCVDWIHKREVSHRAAIEPRVLAFARAPLRCHTRPPLLPLPRIVPLQFFIQLTHGQYHSSLRLVRVHELLRRIGSQSVLRLDCPPSLLLDDVALSLALEEALSNARKYGDGAKEIVISASAVPPSSGSSGSSGSELTLTVSVDSVDQVGAHRLTQCEARRAFEHGFKGPASRSMDGSYGSFDAKSPYSDGIGLSAAADAARAAHGSVALLTSEDETGRVHTTFRLQVPCRTVEQGPGPNPEAPPLSPGILPVSSPHSIETTLAAATASAASGEMWKSGRRASEPPAAPNASAAPRAAPPKPPPGFYTSPPLRREPSRAEHRPYCIVVDDDDMVSDVILHMIDSTGLYETAAFGATLEGQEHMENIILGIHSRLDPAVLLPPPHRSAAIAVIDMHLALPPPWPAHLLTPRADGSLVLPKDGVELAERLRARGFLGKIILHSGESLAFLEELRQSCTAIDAVIEKGNASEFKKDFLAIVGADTRDQDAPPEQHAGSPGE